MRVGRIKDSPKRAPWYASMLPSVNDVVCPLTGVLDSNTLNQGAESIETTTLHQPVDPRDVRLMPVTVEEIEAVRAARARPAILKNLSCCIVGLYMTIFGIVAQFINPETQLTSYLFHDHLIRATWHPCGIFLTICGVALTFGSFFNKSGRIRMNIALPGTIPIFLFNALYVRGCLESQKLITSEGWVNCLLIEILLFAALLKIRWETRHGDV